MFCLQSLTTMPVFEEEKEKKKTIWCNFSRVANMCTADVFACCLFIYRPCVQLIRCRLVFLRFPASRPCPSLFFFLTITTPTYLTTTPQRCPTTPFFLPHSFNLHVTAEAAVQLSRYAFNCLWLRSISLLWRLSRHSRSNWLGSASEAERGQLNLILLATI